MTNISERDFICFIIGGLSGSQEFDNNERAMILHRICEKIDFSYREAQEFVKALNDQSQWYHDNKLYEDKK